MKGEGKPKTMMLDAAASLRAIAAAMRLFGQPALPPEFNRGPKAPEYRRGKIPTREERAVQAIKLANRAARKDQSEREFVLSLGGRRTLRPYKLRGIRNIPESEVEAARADLERLNANG